jgi:hypothetical protein
VSVQTVEASEERQPVDVGVKAALKVCGPPGVAPVGVSTIAIDAVDGER